VKAPVLVKKVAPVFPRSDREYTIGVLILEGIVGRDGRVRDVRILKGPANSYARAAIKAIRQWEYRPATLKGKPVDVYLVISVNHVPMEPDV
jgi:TonB family protein